MTKEAATQFFSKLDEDPSLQVALRTAFPNQGEERTVYGEEMVEFARSHGYEFTIEDLQAELERPRPEVSDGELSDSDLEDVAGGFGIFAVRGGKSSRAVNCMMHSGSPGTGGSGQNCCVVFSAKAGPTQC